MSDPTMTPEQLAQIAYEVYRNSMLPIPGLDPFWSWERMPQERQTAWIAAAQAVKANVLSGFTKVGEGDFSPDF